MLETKNLTKIYKPKKGVPVEALKNVSLKFPQAGMVFLLGKSGSGKSTLLNLLGGLDVLSGGEIIIKGVSSKNFKQQHFDSYRNTYVGFIFQEYNVLEEFSVGANIALAIELQNRRATDGEINEILKEVDLEGYGNRKPNELSGGQKQRVAIARALVKNPQIIMADEPTGALDSVTGRQVFETLKKLSKTKLVIVVSHDREFAEQYADRIIELSDGEVISDVELDNSAPVEEVPGISFNDNIVEVSRGYQLTEEDRRAINEYISKLNDRPLEITVSRKGKSKKRFVDTDQSKIAVQDGSGFKLIKSKLPLKNAFKMGSSALKYKKFRLVFTIFLSFIAFGLFGLADTFGAYNHVKTCTNSIIDTGINYVSVAKSRKLGSGLNERWHSYGYKVSSEDLQNFEKNTKVKMRGVFTPLKGDLGFNGNFDPETEFTKSEHNLYGLGFTGFSEIDSAVLKDFGYKIVAGSLPNGERDEIAISSYIFETFKAAKYTDGTVAADATGALKPVYQEIKSYNDIIGKVLTIGGKKYTVTAVVDTKIDLERYKSLAEEKNGASTTDMIIDYALFNEFNYLVNYSYASVMMVGDGYVERLIQNSPKINSIVNGYIYFNNEYCSIDAQYMAKLSDMSKYNIQWLDGAKTTLGEKEIIVTSDLLLNFYNDSPVVRKEDDTIDYMATLKKNGVSQFEMYGYDYDTSERVTDGSYKVVGIIEVGESTPELLSTLICDDGMVKKYTEGSQGEYKFAIGKMPETKEDIRQTVAYCYNDEGDTRYPMQTSVSYELDTIDEILDVLSNVFLYIGIGFAVFAALMLANFIGTSISHKKQEIGILRAIGSRGNDVFRIFFAESFIIASINFVLSTIAVFSATIIINYVIRHRLGILVTVLDFSLRQVVLLLAVSMAVAALASFLPVKKIASKRPIDAIRNR